MSRLQLADCSPSDPEIQAIYDEITKYIGYIPAAYRAFALQKDILKANWGRTKNVLTKGTLPLLLKESIALAVSGANRCILAIEVHSDKLQKQGVSPEEIEKITTGSSSDEKTNTVLSFCLQADSQPKALTDADFEKLKEFGFSESDILEILTVMEMYSGYSKMITALDLKKTDRIMCE